jgi:hypothetical protein
VAAALFVQNRGHTRLKLQNIAALPETIYRLGQLMPPNFCTKPDRRGKLFQSAIVGKHATEPGYSTDVMAGFTPQTIPDAAG